MKFLKVLLILTILLAAVPTIAQADEGIGVSFDGFSFSFDTALATHVSITDYRTEPADVFPPQGIHTLFVIYGAQPPDTSIDGVRVYRITDMTDDAQLQQVTQLQALLVGEDLASMVDSPLPFLPVIAAGQVLRARVHIVETPDVTGISYVTAYQQAAQPLVQGDFLYTFQGISRDGERYVSAVFRVNPDSFPAEMPAQLDYQAFVDGLPAYLSASAAQLTDAAPETFAPSLDLLNDVIHSFAFQS